MSELSKALKPLFDQAYTDKKWFFCPAQGFCFSPNELKTYQDRGMYLWGPNNWQLIDPPKPTNIADATANLEKENATLANRILVGWVR